MLRVMLHCTYMIDSYEWTYLLPRKGEWETGERESMVLGWECLVVGGGEGMNKQQRINKSSCDEAAGHISVRIEVVIMKMKEMKG